MSPIRSSLFVALLGTLVAGAFAQSSPPPPEEASIPFVNLGSIRDWQANKREGIWIQDTHRRWYYATLMGPCLGLDYALSVGFDTRGSGTLDKFAAVVVPHDDRCQFRSMTRSDAPPKRKARVKDKSLPPEAKP
jgi:Family of unknown function (DUF6491)